MLLEKKNTRLSLPSTAHADVVSIVLSPRHKRSLEMNKFRNCIIAFCGMLALVIAQAPSALAQKYSDWSAPVNLGPAINSASSDQGPAISKDGLSLYFTSNRSGGLGGFDMYVSQRTSVDDPWGVCQ